MLVRGNVEAHWRAVDSILLLLLLITANAPEPLDIRDLQYQVGKLIEQYHMHKQEEQL